VKEELELDQNTLDGWIEHTKKHKHHKKKDDPITEQISSNSAWADSERYEMEWKRVSELERRKKAAIMR
jgi:hypothetical protein